jgi:hypothetical protein
VPSLGFELFTVFEIERSAEFPEPPPPPPPQFDVHPKGPTVIDMLEELFAKLLSVEEADSETLPKLVIVVPVVLAFTVAAMFNTAVELGAMSPIVQRPVELAYDPRVVVAEANVRPEGSTSVAVTPLEVAEPRAETVKV